MGFLSGFMEGVATTVAEDFTARRKIEQEIDLARKKEIALIEPTMEVFKRKQEAEAALKRQLADEEAARFKTQWESMNAPTAPSSLAMPEGLTGPGTSPPTDLNSVNQQLQDTLKKKAAAIASGNARLGQFFDAQADALKAQYTYLADAQKNVNAPVTSAEGVNIVDAIEKRTKEDVKPGVMSRYLPQKLEKFVMDSSVTPLHEQSKSKHKELAQAVSAAKRVESGTNTAEVSDTIINETEAVIRNLNVLNSEDPKVTPEDKMQAAQEIATFISSLSDIERERMASDPNFNNVFTPEVQRRLNSFLGETDQVQEAPKPEVDTTSILTAARNAIARGAPRDKVIERLQANGIDTSGL